MGTVPFDGGAEGSPNFHSMYAQMLHEVVEYGRKVSPRGQPTLELQDVVLELPAETDDGFAHGRTNLRYFLAELAWYASRDPSAKFISRYASLWGRIMNPDGTANSNYGEKIWALPRSPHGTQCNDAPGYRCGCRETGSEWQWCVETLRADPSSRQAVMVIHRPEHHWTGNLDVPCTLTVSFTIREGLLQTRVHMRSSDAWFGLPYDVPFFLWLHRRMVGELGVGRGTFRIMLDSLHLYEHRVDSAKRYLESWRPAASWVCPVPAGLPLDKVDALARELLNAQEAAQHV